jgi:hypothetical protein
LEGLGFVLSHVLYFVVLTAHMALSQEVH